MNIHRYINTRPYTLNPHECGSRGLNVRGGGRFAGGKVCVGKKGVLKAKKVHSREEDIAGTIDSGLRISAADAFGI